MCTHAAVARAERPVAVVVDVAVDDNDVIVVAVVAVDAVADGDISAIADNVGTVDIAIAVVAAAAEETFAIG